MGRGIYHGAMEQITLRLPEDLTNRAEALVPYLESLPALHAAGGTLNRSAVIRVALVRGLEVLETEAQKTGMLKTKK